MKSIITPFNKTYTKAPKASRLYLKFRSKLLFFYITMVILPLVILISCFYFIAEKSSEKTFYISSSASLPAMEGSARQLVGSLNEFANLVIDHISSSKFLASGLSNEAENFATLLKNDAAKAFSGSLEGAYIINGDEALKLYCKYTKNSVISSPSKQPWYNKAVKNPDETVCEVCIRFNEDGTGKPVFTVAKTIPGQNHGSTPSILLLDFDYKMLTELVDPIRATLPKGCELFIINSTNCIIYSEDQALLTLTADPSITSFISVRDWDSEYSTSKIKYNDIVWFAVHKKSSQLSWSFVYMIPKAKALINMLPLNAGTIVLIFACLLTVLIVFPVVLLQLLNPINKLTSVISGQEKVVTSITQKTEGLYKQASPGVLSAASSDLDYLIDKIYSLNLKQKEAELNALQNQINPHFLYNTLESIRGAALYHGIHDIAAMSKALSLMFRYSINSTVLVTVKDEIQHLENYMSIQNFRYENKFELSYEIPYDFYSYKILKLSLQPLIENSIKHGLEMKLGKGTLKVAMFSLDNSIRIHVSDDGTGISQKRIDELNRMLERDEYSPNSTELSDKSGTGIGVRNVNSRIKLYFGEAYGLRFQNTLSGTVVEIILPAVKD